MGANDQNALRMIKRLRNYGRENWSFCLKIIDKYYYFMALVEVVERLRSQRKEKRKEKERRKNRSLFSLSV